MSEELKKRSPLCLCDCGIADYREVLERQKQLQQQRYEDKIPNTVLVVEHPPVITLGARQSANKLLLSREDLAQREIDVVDIRRGGGTTAHNPGQLVFYPILHLRQLALGINEYIRQLEAVGAELLRQLDLKSERIQGLPGLWVDRRKIASIGVRVSKFVTHHGMAINIQNDLSIFDLFVPCGLQDVEITSVQKETNRPNSMSRVKQILCKVLVERFSSEEMAEYEKCA